MVWRLHETANILSEYSNWIRQELKTDSEPNPGILLNLECCLRNLAWAITPGDPNSFDQSSVNYVRSVNVEAGAHIPEISALFEGIGERSATEKLFITHDLEKLAGGYRNVAYEVMVAIAELALAGQASGPSKWSISFNNIVSATLALLLGFALLVPVFVRSRSFSSKPSCLANLKQLEGATATWQLEKRLNSGAIPTWSDIIGKGCYIQHMPYCPEGGFYKLGSSNARPECSLHGRLTELRKLRSLR